MRSVHACFSVALTLIMGMGINVAVATPEANGRATADGVAKLDRAARQALVRDWRDEGRQVMEGLISVGGDAGRTDDERIAAIALLAEFPRAEAITFCLKNVTLRLNKSAIRGDVDMALQRPCAYALGEMRWAAIPTLLEYVARNAIPEPELRTIAGVLVHACGGTMARVLIEKWNPNRGDPQRIRQLIDVLD